MKIVDDDNNNSKYEEFLVLQGGCLKFILTKMIANTHHP